MSYGLIPGWVPCTGMFQERVSLGTFVSLATTQEMALASELAVRHIHVLFGKCRNKFLMTLSLAIKTAFDNNATFPKCPLQTIIQSKALYKFIKVFVRRGGIPFSLQWNLMVRRKQRTFKWISASNYRASMLVDSIIPKQLVMIY